MRRARLTTLIFLLLGTGLAGCRQVASIGILLSPRQIQKAELTLTQDRLALLVETVRATDDNPVFTNELHKKLVTIFKEKNINDQVVPYQEMLRLRQSDPNFSKWSLQKVGRRVDARQLLYVRVETLDMHEEQGSPVLHPRVLIHTKVIDPRESRDAARLWPPSSERGGRLVQCARHQQEAADSMLLDSESAKLAREVAWLVAMPFYDVDLEEKPPIEH